MGCIIIPKNSNFFPGSVVLGLSFPLTQPSHLRWFGSLNVNKKLTLVATGTWVATKQADSILGSAFR